MLTPYLFLVLVPIIAFAWANASCPRYAWRIGGAAFGAIAYPFFFAMTLPLMSIGLENHLHGFFMEPGQTLFILLKGHRPRGSEHYFHFALSAVIWGSIYGIVGTLIDRYPTRKRILAPLLVLVVVPSAYWIIGFSAHMVQARLWSNKHPAGTVCFHVMDADPNASIRLDIGSPSNGVQLARFGDAFSSTKPYCGAYDLSLSPLSVQVYSATDGNRVNRQAVSEDAPSDPLTFPVIAHGKLCVGISSDNASPAKKWTARIVDCALTSHSTGPAQ
jgi:hypothetical protein